MGESVRIEGLGQAPRPAEVRENPSVEEPAEGLSNYEKAAPRSIGQPAPETTIREHEEKISRLAQQLQQAALATDFDQVVALLRGKDPKTVAQALHQIPIDAVVAQILVAQKFRNPFTYYPATLSGLDSRSGEENSLRERVKALFGRIHLINNPLLSYRDKSEVLFQTLSLIARMPPHARPSSLVKEHLREGVEVVSVVQDEKNPEDFLLVVKKGDRDLKAGEDHPAFATKDYDEAVAAAEIFSNVHRTEFIDPQGRLVVRNDNYLLGGGPSGAYDYVIFDRQGLVREKGHVTRPESNQSSYWSVYDYDGEGRLTRQESYVNGKLQIILKYSYDAQGNPIGEGEWASSD